MKKIQLTDTHKEKLFQIPLFRNLPLNIKESLLEKLDFVVYIANKKEIVVTQGTPCNKLYVCCWKGNCARILSTDWEMK